jgi:hypothetical protein
MKTASRTTSRAARRRDGLLGLQGLLYDALEINNYCSWSAMTTVHVSVLGLHKHTVHTQSYAHTHNWDTAASATTRKPTAHNPATITTIFSASASVSYVNAANVTSTGGRVLTSDGTGKATGKMCDGF